MPPATESTDAPVLFVHVMKTGGTTFLDQLSAGLGVEEVWPVSEGPEGQDGWRRYAYPYEMVERPVDEIVDATVVGGHVPLATRDQLARRLGQAPPVVTLLRDPEERVVSHLLQTRALHDKEGLSLEAVYEDPRFHEPLFRDHQTKALAVPAEAALTRAEVDEVTSRLASAPGVVDAILEEVDPQVAPIEACQRVTASIPGPWTWRDVYHAAFQPRVWSHPIDDAYVEVATRRLDEIDVLGVTERFDGFVAAVE